MHTRKVKSCIRGVLRSIPRSIIINFGESSSPNEPGSPFEIPPDIDWRCADNIEGPRPCLFFLSWSKRTNGETLTTFCVTLNLCFNKFSLWKLKIYINYSSPAFALWWQVLNFHSTPFGLISLGIDQTIPRRFQVFHLWKHDILNENWLNLKK